jgi:TonB family protein
MGGFPTPRTDSLSPGESRARLAGLLAFISDDSLREIVQKAVKNTGATGAAIALGSPQAMVSRATAGDCPSEIGVKINSESGLTGLCVSSGTLQYCMNTASDPRVDADACRDLGVAAIVVAPVFYQDQMLGLIELFSQRPYAFGARDLQVLEALSQEFCANLRLSLESTNSIHEVRSASSRWTGKRNQRHFLARLGKIGLYTVAFVACFLLGLRWGWKPTDPVTPPAKGKVTLISTIPVVSPQASLPHVVEGTLLHRVDPVYPEDALRQRIQGQVVLQIRIGKDGFVYDAKVIRGEPSLSQAALDAVRQWRFTPYRMDKKPFDVVAQITLEFSLVR